MTSILDAYPEYQDTTCLDELRRTEYSYLDAHGHVYLDYTGSSLPSASQYRHHQERLSQTVYGNPHSTSPTSRAATEAVEETRARILAHLNASPAEYAVVFTANATAAARLVGEAYPFSRRGTRLVLTADNHNSVHGLREFARAAGAKTTYIPLRQPDMRVDEARVLSALSSSSSSFSSSSSSPPHDGGGKRGSLARRLLRSAGGCGRSERRRRARGLFAYPAQSNFTGVRHPLSWVGQAQQRGYHVLLDAAAYLPTAALDLSEVKPDFVLASWYKVLGYPTGVGCLVARRDALEWLRPRRPWFSGGTIQVVMVAVPWHQKAARADEAFEDGTLNFASIPDVRFGLDWLAAAAGLSVVAARVRCLTGWFLARLQRLRHGDGAPMAVVYGPADTAMRGGTVAFNFVDAAGRVVDERLVALESAAAGISLRTGCFCNPGAGEAAFGWDVGTLRRLSRARDACRDLDGVAGELGLVLFGAVRVSFGIASTAADVDRFFGFAEKTYKDRVTSSAGLGPRT